MARTRATTGAASKTDETTLTKPTLKKLDPCVEAPPQVFVLPKDVSSAARVVTMPDPATFTPNRYLVCPMKGIYEFTRIGAPKKEQRSWLLAPDRSSNAQKVSSGTSEDKGYVLKAPEMMLATPVDPLFLIVPALAGDGNSTVQEFLASADLVNKLTESAPHLAKVMNLAQLESLFAARIEAVSEVMDMGGERVYALSLPKLVKELVSKAMRLAKRGLPASMEHQFVKQVLDVPILSIKREESSISIANEGTSPVAESQPLSVFEPQQSTRSGATMPRVSTAATFISTIESCDNSISPAGVTDLLRLRVALNLVLSSYILPKLRTRLEPLIADPAVSGLEFSILDKHLDKVASLKRDAKALRSFSGSVSRKRANEDDDEVAAAKAEKKRKQQEEESRKKSRSLGFKKLAKADTSGMKKLSSFFTKNASKK